MAGDQEQHRGREPLGLGQTVAVHLARQQFRQQVRTRCDATRLEAVAHEVTERQGRGLGPLLDAGVAAGLVHGDHVVRPRPQPGSVQERHPEQIADHRDRERGRERLDQFGRARLCEAVDGRRCDRDDARTQRLIHAREERTIHERPHAGVLGGFQLEQRMALVGRERGEVRGRLRQPGLGPSHAMQDLAPEAAVAQQCGDVVVAGEAPLVVLRPAEHTACVVQRCVSRIGIRHERGIARVEVEHAGGRLEAARGWDRDHRGRPGVPGGALRSRSKTSARIIVAGGKFGYHVSRVSRCASEAE